MSMLKQFPKTLSNLSDHKPKYLCLISERKEKFSIKKNSFTNLAIFQEGSKFFTIVSRKISLSRIHSCCESCFLPLITSLTFDISFLYSSFSLISLIFTAGLAIFC